MSLLLDTHTILWYVSASPLLSERARLEIDESRKSVLVSSASIWELSIKIGKGKLILDDGLESLIGSIESAGWSFIPISEKEAALAGILPPHHHDPFDRMLVAQCLAYRFDIVSADKALDSYGVPRVW